MRVLTGPKQGDLDAPRLPGHRARPADRTKRPWTIYEGFYQGVFVPTIKALPGVGHVRRDWRPGFPGAINELDDALEKNPTTRRPAPSGGPAWLCPRVQGRCAKVGSRVAGLLNLALHTFNEAIDKNDIDLAA